MKSSLRKMFTYLGLSESQSDNEWQKWYDEQKHKLESGEEVEPPWIAFPSGSPIHGWNQGYQEAWKNSIWAVFWNKLDNTEKENYLNRWKLPSEEWRETIMVYWN